MIDLPDEPPEWIGIAILIIAFCIVILFATVAMKGRTMRLDVNINHPDEETTERLCRIEEKLGIILDNLEFLMSSFDDLKAAQAVTDAKIAAVAADVTALLTKLAAIPVAGLTPEQQAALDEAVTHANAMNASLSATDAAANPPAA